MYLASKKNSTLAETYHVLMILPLIASARELDRFFEHLIAEALIKLAVTGATGVISFCYLILK